MLGQILDLSTRLVDTKSATMMVVLLVGGEERDKNDNGGGSDKDQPQRRLPQKGRMCLAVAPWGDMYCTPTPHHSI